ncbi:MAG: hypothetical protein ACWGQW_25635, partial [bacterium]
MAKKDVRLNPGVQPVDTPDLAHATSMPIPDVSMGTLFEGIGNASQMLVSGVDKAIQRGIRTQVMEGMQTLRNDYGVTDVTNMQTNRGTPGVPGEGVGVSLDSGNSGGTEPTAAPTENLGTHQGRIDANSQQDPSLVTNGPGNVPKDLLRSQDRLGRLQKAMDRGIIDEQGYWARANNIVAQLKSRYPGYTDYIDGIVRSELGRNPANAVQQALFSASDARRQAGVAEYGKRVTFLRGEAGAYIPGYMSSAGMGAEQIAQNDEAFRIVEANYNKARAEKAAADQRMSKIKESGAVSEELN